MDLTSSSFILDIPSTTSVKEYPADSEEINDESTDSEHNREIERKLRLKSIYSNPSDLESSSQLSIDFRNFTACTQCQKPIIELIVWALNKPYHCNCFVCFVCKKTVAFKKFKVVEKKLVTCYKDFYESHQKCRLCQKLMNSDVKLEYDRLYHQNCFKCINCLRPLKEGSTVDLFDESYCRDCAILVVEKKNHLHSYYEALNRSCYKTLTENSSSL